jgi:hypothetical protein
VKELPFIKSSSGAIRYESELVATFRELLGLDPDLEWEFESAGGPPNAGTDGRLLLKLDDTVLRFEVFFSLKPSKPWLEDISHRGGRILVVAPNLPPRVLDFCRLVGLSALDLNGRTWIRAPGALVYRHALPGRSFSYELEPRNIFVGKSERIVRTLLKDVERVWTQATVTKETGASAGLVSRIFGHLVSQGYVEKVSGREYRLADFQGLLDDWVKADSLRKRTSLTRFTGLTGDPQALAEKIHSWSKSEGVRLAFTQWIAAWWRVKYTEPVIVSAYVERIPASASLETLGLRAVDDGGKLWLFVPEDPGILAATREVKGFPIATDAQVYVDLQDTGLRGPEAAEALRESDDFCRRPQ